MKAIKIAARLLLTSIAYVLGTVMSGAILTALHMTQPTPPPGTTPGSLLGLLVLATLLLAIALAPLAAGLGRNFWARCFALFILMYVTVGVNTIIEAAVFSRVMTNGAAYMMAQYILPCAFAAVVLALCFKADAPAAIPGVTVGGWAWRVAVAWMAFPIIYFAFGMCVAPFVIDYYRAGVAGLQIPPGSVILRTQMVRSPLFLVASLPAILLWTRSRGRLICAMGLAHAVTVGIYGLAQATFLPTVLRVVHSIEITADSFAYAAVLAVLFARKQPMMIPTTPPSAGDAHALSTSA